MVYNAPFSYEATYNSLAKKYTQEGAWLMHITKFFCLILTGLALAKQCWVGTQGVTFGYEYNVQSTLNYVESLVVCLLENFCNLDILR